MSIKCFSFSSHECVIYTLQQKRQNRLTLLTIPFLFIFFRSGKYTRRLLIIRQETPAIHF